ncbi:hypothetical protein P5G62_025065 [Neobacillus sp. 179-C4.2 HS]|uniref:DUF3794 domain-containing protein n=1 Tax=Neobacillus driksii TaxID=3035913 RepID=A0ABV4YZX0_9BACI|nr:hypothetical protein [Neobacillus sp. 179.-C4.2 HS]MDP5196731.1 hypothetical protein [Neobacillus sp. 179.-C4.2 HS]
MSQRIGNVGLLNLVNATEESIKGVERIENVGLVLYGKGNAHLLTRLNIGNIGSSLEVPSGYRLYNGVLNLDQNYLSSIVEPVLLLVNGVVIIDRNVQPDQIQAGNLNLMVNGKVYCPAHLSGVTGSMLTKNNGAVETYHSAPPRLENGKFTLTNSFLQSVDEPLFLVVNGLLTFAQDLNLDLLNEKINKLEVNGKIEIFENQEAYLYKKAASLTTCKVEVIPAGYEVLGIPLRLNARSIRRFQQKKWFTNKPVIIESDVSREMLTKAVEKIHSTSVIICHEDVEDLVYERLSLLETEVLSYENNFILIEGEEVWSNDQFLALDQPATFIVKGQLFLDDDVSEEVLRTKVSTLDILGEVVVREKKLKGVLQNIIRLNTGTVEEEKGKEETGVTLQNVGELSL